jgi:hypothetical protein
MVVCHPRVDLSLLAVARIDLLQRRQAALPGPWSLSTFREKNDTVALIGSGNMLSVGSFTNGGLVGLAGSGNTLRAGSFTNTGTVLFVAPNEFPGIPESINNSLAVTGAFSNNGGAVSLAGSGDTLSTGSFTNNAGAVFVGQNENLNVTNGYTQSGGSASLKVNGAMVVGTATINGGVVSGSGNITGAVDSIGGTVTASDPGIPDTLTIDGNYMQGANGVLEAFLGGTTADPDYSRLIVIGGTGTLGGTLDLDLVPGSGLEITPGESFDLVTATGCGVGDCVTGSFSSVVGLPTLPGDDSWLVAFNGGSLDVTLTGTADHYAPATPEPSVLLLLAIGIALMTFFLKHRNNVRRAAE